MTNFYYSGSRQRLKLIEENFDTTGSDEDMSEEEDNSSDRNWLSGFVGWEASDMSYEAMLEHLGFSVKHEEMSKEPDEQEIPALPLDVTKNCSLMYLARMEFIPVVPWKIPPPPAPAGGGYFGQNFFWPALYFTHITLTILY